MNWAYRITWSQIFIAAGLGGMIAGAIDPLEGWPEIAIGCVAVAVGAGIESSRYWVVILVGSVLIGLGVAAMLLLSQMGGIGGNSGRSMWWGLTILPYPVGWFVELVAGVFAFIETIKKSRAQRPGV
jgi:hypothetical protein